ncbi:MAG: Sporulation domain protein, partial [Myxococcales bacterium]|nr:Sporulation domain protein [Myxococcales bacterium]
EKKLEVEKKDGEKRTGEKKLDAEKKADKKIEAGEKREIEKKESEKKDSEKKDIEKKEGEKKAEVKPRFTLQLSSFQDKTEAQAFLDSIKSSGFQAYLTEGEVDGKQYFRVRLGNYRSMDAANDAKSEFEKAAKKSALVTRL